MNIEKHSDIFVFCEENWPTVHRIPFSNKIKMVSECSKSIWNEMTNIFYSPEPNENTDKRGKRVEN